MTRLERLAREWRPTPIVEAPAPADLLPPLAPWEALLADAQTLPDMAPPAFDEPLAVDGGPDTDGRVRLGPWSGSALRGLALLIAVALVVAGWWWWSGRPRAIAVIPTVVATGVPITGSLPGGSANDAADGPLAGSGGQVVVHVTGLVARPGLVHLPAGSRVADAVEAAGGVTRRRAADTVNLARVLVDGEQVVVGVASGASSGGVGAGGVTPVTNLNTATAAEFELLPGVGPVLAGRIVQWRTTNGPFRSVDELGEVSGIGDSIMGQLRPLVRV